SDFDQTIRYNASVNYVIPRANVQGWKSAVVNDWQVNAIVSLQTGFPFPVLSCADRSLSGIGNDYADQVGNPARPAGVSKIKEYFNTAAFVPATIGTSASHGSSIVAGPGYELVDTSLHS